MSGHGSQIPCCGGFTTLRLIKLSPVEPYVLCLACEKSRTVHKPNRHSGIFIVFSCSSLGPYATGSTSRSALPKFACRISQDGKPYKPHPRRPSLVRLGCFINMFTCAILGGATSGDFAFRPALSTADEGHGPCPRPQVLACWRRKSCRVDPGANAAFPRFNTWVAPLFSGYVWLSRAGRVRGAAAAAIAGFLGFSFQSGGAGSRPLEPQI